MIFSVRHSNTATPTAHAPPPSDHRALTKKEMPTMSVQGHPPCKSWPAQTRGMRKEELAAILLLNEMYHREEFM